MKTLTTAFLDGLIRLLDGCDCKCHACNPRPLWMFRAAKWITWKTHEFRFRNRRRVAVGEAAE